uniref:Uncharacterized protein n=1 Tax=Pyramimonas obovata TaxID=1411642 RepID=A0A7S0MYF2_9CHLO|mmetsp:Transcript_16045/g.34859  ORF Transcript_16045/g.34859 Transcript_16045/m.34859 type:complete len:138 (+) Transcript_16045:128-541(+)
MDDGDYEPGQIPDDEDVSVDVNENEDCEDLYGDLYDDQGREGETLLKEKVRQLEAKFQSADKERSSIKRKLQEVETEVEQLREQNNTLTRNISCIYKTAKNDAARRDSEIKEMRIKLSACLACEVCNPPNKGKMIAR